MMSPRLLSVMALFRAMIFRYHDLSGGRMQPRRIPINQYGLTTIKLKFWGLRLIP
jgi:hypothetical protein